MTDVCSYAGKSSIVENALYLLNFVMYNQRFDEANGPRSYQAHSFCSLSFIRSYFLSNKADVVQETQEDSDAASKEVDVIRNQREVVQKKLKETEAEFKELIQGNPQLVRQLQGLRT